MKLLLLVGKNTKSDVDGSIQNCLIIDYLNVKQHKIERRKKAENEIAAGRAAGPFIGST